jgi:hypothetical protein
LIQSLLPADSYHGEHGVRYDPVSDRYVKFTRADRHQGFGVALGAYVHGASPAEYLDRLALNNEIFHDDVRLEGVLLRPGDRVAIVTSQPRIAGVAASVTEIDALMAALAAERLCEGAFLLRDRGILAFDLMPRNVVRSSDGVVYPIDPVIQRVTSDFADFLARHPERIHDRP